MGKTNVDSNGKTKPIGIREEKKTKMIEMVKIEETIHIDRGDITMTISVIDLLVVTSATDKRSFPNTERLLKVEGTTLKDHHHAMLVQSPNPPRSNLPPLTPHSSQSS